MDCTVIYAENDIDTYATFIQEFQLQVQFTFRVNYSPLLPKKHHLTIRLTNFKVGEKKTTFRKSDTLSIQGHYPTVGPEYH